MFAVEQADHCRQYRIPFQLALLEVALDAGAKPGQGFPEFAAPLIFGGFAFGPVVPVVAIRPRASAVACRCPFASLQNQASMQAGGSNGVEAVNSARSARRLPSSSK
jgi:hypothetical protein